MADCSKDEIPEELIKKKGEFKCKGTYTPDGFSTYYGCQYPSDYGIEYEPSDGDIIAEGPPDYNHQIFGSIPSYDALMAATGTYFPLHNVTYEDTYMSWESDEITVGDRPPQTARPNTILGCQCECCGENGIWVPASQESDGKNFYPFQPPPARCAIISKPDLSSFTGSVVNIAWYGCTLKFIFNIYKTYCCTLDGDGNIIDYDYYYSFVNWVVKDGKSYLGGDSTQYRVGLQNSCLFCAVNKTGPAIPGLAYPSYPWETISPPLRGRFYIPLKVKEF